MSNKILFKTAWYVGILIVISKIFGLLRDLVIANIYGTSITADAYNFAYLLTGNFLILLGGLGGPFHSATIAMLTRVKDDAKEAGSFLIKIFGSAFVIFSLITFLILFFKDQIIHLIIPATGLSESYREKLWFLTGMHLEIMSPLIIISGLLGIACGIANVYKGFFFPAIGPVFPSIFIIWLALTYHDREIGIALALGTLFGAVIQLLVQFYYILKAGFYENLRFAIVEKQKIVSSYYEFLGPALLSTTIGQITVYIDGFFCSGLPEGSWTATIFANRLIQLPLGVLIVSFLVPFFPRFSELATAKNFEKLKNTSSMVIRTLWFLSFPVAVYLFLFAKPVVKILFQRGEFDERSTILVSSILTALLLSIIAYVARDTLTRVFYALGNSKIPLIVAACAIVLKIILNMALVEKYQAPGIAFSTSLVTVFNFLLLWILLRKKIGFLGFKKHLVPVIKMVFAAAILFISGKLFLTAAFFEDENYNFMFQCIFLGISFFACFAVYFGLALMLKIEEASQIFKEVKAKLRG